jgi:hypothetical protein
MDADQTSKSGGRTDYTGIAALITAIGGIVFGVIRSEQGTAQREAGYSTLASTVSELVAHAQANTERIGTIERKVAPDAPPPKPFTISPPPLSIQQALQQVQARK